MGRAGSTFAFQMVGVAVGWQLYTLTNSALDLGLVGLVQAAPAMCCFPISGEIADRFDRRRVAAICMALQAIVTALLAAGAATAAVSAPMLFFGVLLIGVGRAFEVPAATALLPNLVERDELQVSTATATAATNFAQMAGPALGGLLYVAGASVTYAVAAGLGLISATLLLCTRPRSSERATGRPTWESLSAGAAFVVRHPVVLGIFTLDFFAVIMGGAVALLPIYVRDIFGAGPWALGLLRSAPAIGSFAMTLMLGRIPLRRHVGVTLFATVGAYGLATIAFALSHSLWIAFVALVATGVFDAVSRVIRWTILQLATPDDVRGRVSAVISMFTNSSGLLGQFESGIVAAWLGAVASALTGGLGTIAIALAWSAIFPQIRRIDGIDDGGSYLSAKA